MKPTAIILAAVAAVIAAASGYWVGVRQAPHTTEVAASAAQTGERRILYYRNPMGLPDTSPVPKKDPMGMDYIPVYEGGEADDADPRLVSLTTAKVQRLGVRSEAVSIREIGRTVRGPGRIEADERRIHAVAPRFAGWVERLHVDYTGRAVKRGEPLFTVYSPDLAAAGREFAIAARAAETMKDADPEALASMQRLAKVTLDRLRNWGVPEDQIRRISEGDTAGHSVVMRAPVSGVVLEKTALAGSRFMPGETLYRIADLSTVWVIADIYERDIGLVREGAEAIVTADAWPGERFSGRIAYVWPTVDANTRTVPVRVELPNPDGRFRPGMFTRLELKAQTREAVAVPLSAVIDSGRRQIVLVDLGAGRFEPREVRLGVRGDDHVEVLDGVREGERVVVAANFLIDAESNLKAALGAFTDVPPARDEARAKAVVHHAKGVVAAIDARTNALTLEHDEVESLGWPAMTMDFTAANGALLEGLVPGDAVGFEFVERAPGEWVVTRIEKRNGHAGH